VARQLSDTEVLGRRPAASPQDFVVQRAARADVADARLRGLLDPGAAGVALVAVGGYGRRELSPYSDLDVVLVHADDVDPQPVAEQIWYPLWDDGVALDHSVRTVEEMRATAASDIRAALGLLDARHVTGDPSLTLQVRTQMLADWRSGARRRLPELAAGSLARAERWGDLAHIAVPHLKESRGGLRDGVMLRGLVATWLVDVPHAETERCRRWLLAVRDALHTVAGRSTDRLPPEAVPVVGELLGTDDLDRRVREVGRRTAYLTQLTWRRVEHVIASPTRARRPVMAMVAPGVAEAGGEIVLPATARPGRDPLVVLRAAVAAAERDLVLSPATAVRLARESASLPEPWPSEGRRLLVRLLGSGTPLIAVWEALDQAGAVDAWLPEWKSVALLRSDSPVHRFTVDRHLVETCVEASRLLRRVRRPDLLLAAALLHDIGKGGSDDHSRVGGRTARDVMARWGFDEADGATVARLVELHLLLPHTATRRDLDDPATARAVADVVGSTELLDLLAALTEADARATGPSAWTSWRARLVSKLLRRTRAVLEGDPERIAAEIEGDARLSDQVPTRHLQDGEVLVRTEPHADGTVVEVGLADRIGVLADVAGALATAGLEVLSARVGTRGKAAWSRWLVSDPDVDDRRLRQRLLRMIDGTLAVELEPPQRRADPVVAVHLSASDSATVLEVRDHDWRGLVAVVCGALADAGVDVRSAHVETIGPQAVDVFYVRGADGLPLDQHRAGVVRDLVQQALTGRGQGPPVV
jgi:[protein-PII] uridylyltransferase